jgi:organic hydroperoxide reductase OsmC/OhrA
VFFLLELEAPGTRLGLSFFCSSPDRVAAIKVSVFRITRSALTLRVQVPTLDETKFAEMARDAEKNGPVSKVLNAEITLDAKLI